MQEPTGRPASEPWCVDSKPGQGWGRGPLTGGWRAASPVILRAGPPGVETVAVGRVRAVIQHLRPGWERGGRESVRPFSWVCFTFCRASDTTSSVNCPSLPFKFLQCCRFRAVLNGSLVLCIGWGERGENRDLAWRPLYCQCGLDPRAWVSVPRAFHCWVHLISLSPRTQSEKALCNHFVQSPSFTDE